eukprot:754843_1
MGNANTVDAPKSKSNRSNEPNVKYKQTKMNSNSVYAPKQTKMKKVKVEFKLHVVIHLGADETAMAFVYEGKVHHNRFKCRTTKDRRKCRTTKTQILLNSQHECVHFGGGADFMYYNIDHRKEFKLFDRFKMKLYETHLDREEPNNETVDIETYLTAVDGERVEAGIVFVAAFRTLQRLAKEHIARRIVHASITDDEIQWIVTVPAIFNHSAKHKMKTWITKAGLVNVHATIPNQCIFVCEADCASLSIKEQYQKDIRAKEDCESSNIDTADSITESKSSNDHDPEHDEKTELMYLLVDAGGVNVNFTCHNIRDDGFIEDVAPSTGFKWGSAYIDDLFIVFLADIFGKQLIDEYKEKNPSGVLEILNDFQRATETFNRENYSNNNGTEEEAHGVLLPDEFVCFLDERADPAVMLQHYAANKTLNDIERLILGSTKNSNETKIVFCRN